MNTGEKNKILKELSREDNIFFREMEDRFYPFLVEPVVYGDELDAVRVVSSTGKVMCVKLITKRMLDCCEDMNNLILNIKKQISYEIEWKTFEDRYEKTLAKQRLTNYKYMVDIAMPINEVLICVHPTTYKSFLCYESNGFDNVYDKIKEEKRRE